VALIKSTARPMTSEELAAAGGPTTGENVPPVQLTRLPKPFAIPAVAKMKR
jgi:hypothetical protein